MGKRQRKAERKELVERHRRARRPRIMCSLCGAETPAHFWERSDGKVTACPECWWKFHTWEFDEVIAVAR